MVALFSCAWMDVQAFEVQWAVWLEKSKLLLQCVFGIIGR